MDKALKEKLTATDKWLRLVFMVMFAAVNYIVQVAVWLIAGFQFIAAMLLGAPNTQLLGFGASLSQYSYQILRYLMYDTEEKPYPFGDWPKHKSH